MKNRHPSNPPTHQYRLENINWESIGTLLVVQVCVSGIFIGLYELLRDKTYLYRCGCVLVCVSVRARMCTCACVRVYTHNSGEHTAIDLRSLSHTRSHLHSPRAAWLPHRAAPTLPRHSFGWVMPVLAMSGKEVRYSE